MDYLGARDQEDRVARLAETIGRMALASDRMVAVAESLTGGGLSQALAKAADASEWFAGAVVAYRDLTKFRVLAVPEGPVVTPDCARAMAFGVRRLTGADVAVAVTGVGGPGEEEGHPAGTVYVGVASSSGADDFAYRFSGGPNAVVARTVEVALRHLVALLQSTGVPAH